MMELGTTITMLICNMGNQRLYQESGGFTDYLYKDESAKVTINGVTGKMISKITDPTGNHDGLPTYSNSSDIYLKKGKDGLAIQAKVYKDRKVVLDFDWNHEHKNSDGTKFPKGTIHVQVYKVEKNGDIVRISKSARPMTKKEKEKYGPIIMYFNPNVKF